METIGFAGDVSQAGDQTDEHRGHGAGGVGLPPEEARQEDDRRARGRDPW